MVLVKKSTLKIFQDFAEQLSFSRFLTKVMKRDTDFSVSYIRVNSGRIGIFWEFKSFLQYHRHNYHMEKISEKCLIYPNFISFYFIVVVVTLDYFLAFRKLRFDS